MAKGNYRHGHKTNVCTTPEYEAWRSLIQRCTNPRVKNYANYGGRGIKVCDHWREDFRNFLADMGSKPGPGRQWSIDRINNDGDYEPGNCRWASRKDQMRHVSYNRLLTFEGRTQCLAAWAEELGVPSGTIQRRLNKLGWSVEKALTEPIHSGGQAPVLVHGVSGTPAQLARAFGFKWPTIYMRMKKGMSLEEALVTPIGMCNSR